ncbi:MAG: hypothetical protein IKS68_03495, partial [Mailhella sp.]|nr:hypothetical protein [Mailhella sp.]
PRATRYWPCSKPTTKNDLARPDEFRPGFFTTMKIADVKLEAIALRALSSCPVISKSFINF